MNEAKEAPVIFEKPLLQRPDQTMALSCSFQAPLQRAQRKVCENSAPRQNNKDVTRFWLFLPCHYLGDLD
jgi:hypothetical protein